MRPPQTVSKKRGVWVILGLRGFIYHLNAMQWWAGVSMFYLALIGTVAVVAGVAMLGYAVDSFQTSWYSEVRWLQQPPSSIDIACFHRKAHLQLLKSAAAVGFMLALLLACDVVTMPSLVKSIAGIALALMTLFPLYACLIAAAKLEGWKEADETQLSKLEEIQDNAPVKAYLDGIKEQKRSWVAKVEVQRLEHLTTESNRRAMANRITNRYA